MMNREDLENLVEERKQQAVDRDIYYKAEVILHHLDLTDEGYFKDNLGILKYVFSNKEMKFDIGISWNEEAVFYGRLKKDSIKIYVPGEWEDCFEQVYQEAEKKGRIHLVLMTTYLVAILRKSKTSERDLDFKK